MQLHKSQTKQTSSEEQTSPVDVSEGKKNLRKNQAQLNITSSPLAKSVVESCSLGAGGLRTMDICHGEAADLSRSPLGVQVSPRDECGERDGLLWLAPPYVQA